MSLRLFLALWPAATAARALVAWHRQWQWPAGAAVVAPAKLHLTLHFIGPVPAGRLDEIRAALAVPCAPFELPFGRAEIWPRGLAVLVPHAMPAELGALHARLADALRSLALPVDERPFKPHVTLARKAAGASAPALALATSWPVHAYALVQSEAGYRMLQHYG